MIFPVCLAQEEITHNGKDSRKFAENNPVRLLDVIYGEANRTLSEGVQNTQYDTVHSGPCAGVGSTFTISNTLCNLKSLSTSYLQYIIYIWLAVATIMIIRNWFKLVTSQDREKQLTTFKKNLIYIVVWVILLVWFYYILDFFVSVVNVVSK